MSSLLDTDWVISFLNGRPEAVTLVTRLADDGIAVSVISCGEIYEGLLRDPQSARRVAQFERFTTTVDIVTLDARAARVYARIRSQLRAQGQLIPDNDTWIAATALAYHFTLVSRDQHFSRIPDLNLSPSAD